MEAAMRKMGMQQQEIEASEVIIKTHSKDVVIESPQVSKINVMGQDMFQITGNVIERAAEINEEDVKTVSEQAGVSFEAAKKALGESNGDLAAAIMKLKS
jgi:nascent polypeptide-associated complex subunit alpha